MWATASRKSSEETASAARVAPSPAAGTTDLALSVALSIAIATIQQTAAPSSAEITTVWAAGAIGTTSIRAASIATAWVANAAFWFTRNSTVGITATHHAFTSTAG